MIYIVFLYLSDFIVIFILLFQHKILTLDGHLQNTLRYQIRAGELMFGTGRPYGAAHHFGAVIKPKTAQALNVGGRPVKKVVIPARPWLGISTADGALLIDIARSYLNNGLVP